MGLIVYDEKTILDAKNRIDTCNGQILEALEKLHNEFENMSVTLNTPKSSKSMPQLIDFYNKKITFVRNSKDNYNKMFNNIIADYHNYSDTVKQMVGGNND